MAYRELAAIPQKYADAWMLFLRDRLYELKIGTKAQATNARHTMHWFRNLYRRAAGPINGSIFDEIELIIKRSDDGLWSVACDTGGWASRSETDSENSKEPTMTQKLKPVSEAMRRALALLGETPEEHQKEKLSVTTRNRGRGDQRQPFVPSRLESSASVARKLLAKEPEPTWLADARVLFTRTRTCRCCQVTASEMHYTETFIRMRSKADPKTLKYIPARSSLFANLELPKLTINTPVKTYYCPSCWIDDERPLENPVCLSELRLLAAGTYRIHFGFNCPDEWVGWAIQLGEDQRATARQRDGFRLVSDFTFRYRGVKLERSPTYLAQHSEAPATRHLPLPGLPLSSPLRRRPLPMPMTYICNLCQADDRGIQGGIPRRSHW